MDGGERHTGRLCKTARVAATLAMAWAMASCSVTKYVGDDEMLLDRVHIEGDMGDVTESDMQAYVRQQPNSRFLRLWRVNLCVYSLSGDSDSRLNRWLRRVGQEPVTYDSEITVKSSEQLRLYLVSRGYFNAQVSDTVIRTRHKRCEVTYHVVAGQVYRIHSLGYSVPDDEVGRIVMSDTANSLIKPGLPFDTNVHDDERERITRRLQERGYYFFGKDYVYFVADSSGLDHAVRDSLIVVNALGGDDRQTQVPHRKAVIGKVDLFVSGTTDDNAHAAPPDTVCQVQKGMTATFNGRQRFRKDLIRNSCFIIPDSTFSITDVELTRSRLTSLKAIRQATFQFVEGDSAKNSTDSIIHINCIGRITTNKTQSIGVDLDGTNSSGNLGAAVSLRYSHSNVFRGAEALSVKTRLAMQNQTAAYGKGSFSTLEMGSEATLTFPFMIAPISSLHFYKRHNPRTLVSISYDYQRRPEFTRNVLATRMTYNWRGSAYVTHSLTPVEFNIVRIPTLDSDFEKYISGTYLQHAYTDHFIMSLGYTFVYNQQKVRRNQSGAYVRLNVETAGNFLSLCTRKQETPDGYKSLWDIRFSQYIRTEAEFRYQAVDQADNCTVFRIFGGLGKPYGNSIALPYEKSFFVGGANSIRAWPVRGLGPGSTPLPATLRYHNQIGDIRLEANAEYRFKIISVFEGAAFVDAGNIWTLNNGDAEGNINGDFYKQIALGAGLGIRLNFDYFIFRMDAAYPLHDPQSQNRKWVIRNRFDGDNIAWNFAIGYPF